MNIERARKLKVGDRVYYPADRGDPAGDGRVTAVFPAECTHMNQAPFIWVEVQMPGIRKTVWPTNRLG